MTIITILKRRQRLQEERAAKYVEAQVPASPAGGINAKLQQHKLNFHFSQNRIHHRLS
jgi:hypothetical protein